MFDYDYSYRLDRISRPGRRSAARVRRLLWQGQAHRPVGVDALLDVPGHRRRALERLARQRPHLSAHHP